MPIIARWGAIALFLAALPNHALADAKKANLARVMWAAFECGTYAEMTGDKARMEVLYKHGIEAGRGFVRAVRANEITREEMNKSVPLVVIMLLGGDSDDFMVGRIFEAAITNAHDNIVKRDDGGVSLEPSKWTLDPALKALKARNKYNASNCVLISPQ